MDAVFAGERQNLRPANGRRPPKTDSASSNERPGPQHFFVSRLRISRVFVVLTIIRVSIKLVGVTGTTKPVYKEPGNDDYQEHDDWLDEDC